MNLSLPFLKKRDTITQPEAAYDIWSSFYDNQPDNLMLRLDEQILYSFLKNIDIKNKICIDFGCGTGRHWDLLLSRHPFKLTGLDVSSGMLQMLKEKFPEGEIHKIENNKLSFILNESIDAIFSTLTIAHIEDINELFESWNRISKPDSDLIITDFHPDILANGGKRNFIINGRQIHIRNYVHSLDDICSVAAKNGFVLIKKSERFINEEVKHFYIKQNALHIYNKYKDLPLIYGLHLKKQWS